MAQFKKFLYVWLKTMGVGLLLIVFLWISLTTLYFISILMMAALGKTIGVILFLFFTSTAIFSILTIICQDW